MYTVQLYFGKWTVFTPRGAATMFRFDDPELAQDVADSLTQARTSRSNAS